MAFNIALFTTADTRQNAVIFVNTLNIVREYLLTWFFRTLTDQYDAGLSESKV